MHSYSLYICDKVVRVEEENSIFFRFCRGYIIKEPAPEPDYIISITKEAIVSQCKTKENDGDSLLSGFLVLKELAKLLLLDERTLCFHGSVVAYNNSAFMFAAPSGTGKTTHSLLWTENLPDAYILNGDKPFVSTGSKIVAWGSPWCGSEHYNRNEGVELKAICFLERADKNRIIEFSWENAFPMLTKHTGDPDPLDFHTKIWIMEGLNRLRGRVKFYRYEMNNLEEKEAFHTTYDVLSKL